MAKFSLSKILIPSPPPPPKKWGKSWVKFSVYYKNVHWCVSPSLLDAIACLIIARFAVIHFPFQVPCNVSDSMKDSFKNRYKYFKRPEDIE